MLARRAFVLVPCVVVIAGCFGKIREDTIPAPAPTPTSTTTVPTHRPEPPEPPPHPDPPVPEGCMAQSPIDSSQLPYAPPAAPQVGACTTDDVDAFRQYVDSGQAGTTQELVDFVKKRSTTCAACIFTDANGSMWGPIPLVNGDAETVNVGACWALVTGDAACGKAAQNEQDCGYAACTDCYDQVEFEKCQQAAGQAHGPCDAEHEAFQAACASAAPTVATKCADFYDSIRVQCVSGP